MDRSADGGRQLDAGTGRDGRRRQSLRRRRHSFAVDDLGGTLRGRSRHAASFCRAASTSSERGAILPVLTNKPEWPQLRAVRDVAASSSPTATSISTARVRDWSNRWKSSRSYCIRTCSHSAMKERDGEVAGWRGGSERLSFRAKRKLVGIMRIWTERGDRPPNRPSPFGRRSHRHRLDAPGRRLRAIAAAGLRAVPGPPRREPQSATGRFPFGRATSTPCCSATPTSTTAATCPTWSSRASPAHLLHPGHARPGRRHARRRRQDPGGRRRLSQPPARQGRAEGRAALRWPRRVPDAAALQGGALRHAVRASAADWRRRSWTPATCSARR